MTSDQAYRIFNLLLFKDVNGYYNPEEWELFMNMAQVELFSDRVGPIDEYQQGRPIPGQAYDSTGRVSRSIRMFRLRASIPLTNGIGTFPDDFAYYDAASFRYWTGDCTETSDKPGVKKHIPINEVFEQGWANMVSSTINYPTTRFPIFKFWGQNEIEVSPDTIQRINFVYLRYPKDIYWGRTFANNTYTHDPTDPLNQDPEWDDMETYSIIAKALKLAGMSEENDKLYQMAKDMGDKL